MRKLPAGVRKRKTGLLEKRFSVKWEQILCLWQNNAAVEREGSEEAKTYYGRRICTKRKYDNRPVFCHMD